MGVQCRNITLSLPAELIRRAKIYAVQHDTTVNALVKDLLQETLSRKSRTRLAAEQLLGLAEQGLTFSADLSTIRRQDIYDRR